MICEMQRHEFLPNVRANLSDPVAKPKMRLENLVNEAEKVSDLHGRKT